MPGRGRTDLLQPVLPAPRAASRRRLAPRLRVRPHRVPLDLIAHCRSRSTWRRNPPQAVTREPIRAIWEIWVWCLIRTREANATSSRGEGNSGPGRYRGPRRPTEARLGGCRPSTGRPSVLAEFSSTCPRGVEGNDVTDSSPPCDARRSAQRGRNPVERASDPPRHPPTTSRAARHPESGHRSRADGDRICGHRTRAWMDRPRRAGPPRGDPSDPQPSAVAPGSRRGCVRRRARGANGLGVTHAPGR